MQPHLRANGSPKSLGAGCGFLGCLQAGVPQGCFQALSSGGWVQSSLASGVNLVSPSALQKKVLWGRGNRPRGCRPCGCTLSPRQGLTAGRLPPVAQSPATLRRPLSVQAPSSYTLATAHRTPGRKQRDTWDELDGDPKAERLGSLTKSR